MATKSIQVLAEKVVDPAAPTLGGCWAKLRRADLHLTELTDKIGEYVKADHSRLSGNYDADAFTYELRVEAAEAPNHVLWSVIVGDIVHNLRSALDHLVWQLVLLANARSPGPQHEFPIALDEQVYRRKGGMRDRMLAGVAETHRAIIDRVQPFVLGDDAENHSLAHLKRLSNTDKHRVLPLVMFTTQLPVAEDFVLGDAADECEIEIEIPGGLLVGPTVLGILRVRGSAHFDPATVVKSGQFRIEFGFADIERRGITSGSLREVWSRVGALVYEFRDAFGSAGDLGLLENDDGGTTGR